MQPNGGQAVVEFAVLAPLLLLALTLTVDFGRVYYLDLSLRDAAFAAARYGGMNPNDDTGIKNAAVAAAQGQIQSTAQVTVSGTPPRGSGQALTVTVTSSFRPITPLVSNLTGSSIQLTRSQTDIVK